MKHQPKSMHDTNRQEAREHQHWIDTLEKWRIEHKEALAKLTKMQAALMEHDAEIDAQLAQIRRHNLFIEHEEKRNASKTNGQSHPIAPNPYGDLEEHRKAHRELREKLQKSGETHRQTQKTLRKTIETMRGIRADSFHDVLKSDQEPDDAEVLHQAGIESFPASDPPSFNRTTL